MAIWRHSANFERRKTLWYWQSQNQHIMARSKQKKTLLWTNHCVSQTGSKGRRVHPGDARTIIAHDFSVHPPPISWKFPIIMFSSNLSSMPLGLETTEINKYHTTRAHHRSSSPCNSACNIIKWWHRQAHTRPDTNQNVWVTWSHSILKSLRNWAVQVQPKVARTTPLCQACSIRHAQQTESFKVLVGVLATHTGNAECNHNYASHLKILTPPRKTRREPLQSSANTSTKVCAIRMGVHAGLWWPSHFDQKSDCWWCFFDRKVVLQTEALGN